MSWIAEELASRGGAVPFRDFVEIALYHHTHGYYRASRPRFGRGGDFLTAPSASPWYGAVLACLLARLASRVGRLSLVDVGAGDGSFIEAVSSSLAADATRVLGEVFVVEGSTEMRLGAARRLSRQDVPVRYLEGTGDLGTLTGPSVFHASELYDAQPFHRVVMRAHGLQELWVSSSGDSLSWQERPAPSFLKGYFSRHGVTLQPGQLAEANVGAEGMHGDLLQRATGAALALVLDYGYPASRLYDPRARAGGSLACFRDHRLTRDPLAAPGEQDITAHVNWDDLLVAGRAAGFRDVGLWPLAEFMVRAGLADALERSGLGLDAPLDARTVTERQEIKRLLDPDGMGSDLKVMVQARGALLDAAVDMLGVPG